MYNSGNVLRSDGRTYGEISKAGLLIGLLLGVLVMFGGFIISERPLLVGFMGFIGTTILTTLWFVISAGFYDLANYFIDN